MQALPNSCYYSPEVYQAEHTNIFKSSWIFACMRYEVSNNNDFYEFTIADTPVVIQNFRGEIKAFVNVCPHRFNRIQTNGWGNRPFFCAYHAWGFDKDGNCKIPNAKGYDECVKERKLISLHLDNCGDFLFISFEEKPKQTLQEQLGTMCDQLLFLSELKDNEISRSDMPHNCNWKFIVENAIECMHCKHIHPETFCNLGFGNLPPINEHAYNGSSKAEYPRSEKGKAALNENKFYKKLLDARITKSDNYHHTLIFPNLMIGSVSYMQVYIAQVLPVTHNTSILRIRNYDVKLEGNIKSTAVYSYLIEETIASNGMILQEDRPVIENIQRSLTVYPYNAILHEEESRIKEFHRGYRQYMDV